MLCVRFDLALEGFNRALTLSPSLILVQFNRAHLHSIAFDCCDALRDLRSILMSGWALDPADQQYLTEFYEYCKRFQWGVAVACRDVARGIQTLPGVRTLNLSQPVVPPGTKPCPLSR